ncbi:MAG: DUF3638 domain-containing protein, partial [Tatlockia sp.]|nr:DUF3638 domain-containing protein [Tatlockia sp.]
MNGYENNNKKTDYSRKLVKNKIFSSLPLDKNKLILWLFENNIYKTPDAKWEFRITRSDDISEIYQTITIEGRQKRLKLNKDYLTYFDSKKINNPFLNSSFDSNFNYWICDDEEELIFVESQNQDYQFAYLKTLKQGWVQLKISDTGWARTNEVLFDVDAPETEMEKQWSERLKTLFGFVGIKVSAELNHNNECVIKQITIAKLSLSFTCKNNRLECDNFPGFYLSDKQSLPELKGLSIIILVNDDEKEKFLLSPFQLKKIEGNSIFLTSDFLDQKQLCLPYSFPENRLACFIYEYDHQKQLIANNLEAYLYLALLYRCQSDYQKAMHYLEHTNHHQNNHEELYDLIEMLYERQDQSALGAAFDCKVACRMYHHVGKWSEANDKVWEKSNSSKKFLKFSTEQFNYYKKTISDYKTEIHIIPLYLRLTEDEIQIMENINNKQKTDEELKAKQSGVVKSVKQQEKKPVLNEMHRALTNERLKEINNLSFLNNCKSEDGLKDFFQSFGFDDKRHYFQTTNRPLSLRKYYDYTNIDLNSQLSYGSHPSHYPGLDFLKTYYVNFFAEARSSDKDNQRQLKLEWYYLLQNDSDFYHIQRMIALLVFVMKYPNLFANIDVHQGMTSKECFEQIVKQCYLSVYTEKREQSIELCNPQGELIEFTERHSLPSSFLVEETLYFRTPQTKSDDDLFSVLQNLAIDYFLPPIRERVAKRQVLFAKNSQINTRRSNTLLENHLLAHYEKGHAQNLQKQKTIYRWSPNANLSSLVNELVKRKNDAEHTLIQLQKVLEQSGKGNAADDLLAIAYKGEQLAEIQSHLRSALLIQDVKQLNACNPFLNQENIDQLLHTTADFLILQSHVDQINAALELVVEKGKPKSLLSLYEQQLLGSILNKTRYYSIEEFPEFLVYEYATKRLLRSDQVDILKNLIACIEKQSINSEEMHHALLQFEAGGGKTRVIIPILAHRFARMGFLPVIINTNELYNTGIKDIPESLKSSLNQGLEVLERELDHKWTLNELEKLHSDLEKYRKQKKVLLIKAITWHSIHITSQIAYSEHN